jgi:hypothetical protein
MSPIFFGLIFPKGEVVHCFFKKNFGWASFWAIFSQTRLITLKVALFGNVVQVEELEVKKNLTFVLGSDGLFSDQKSQFWFIFVGLGIENFGIFLRPFCYF